MKIERVVIRGLRALQSSDHMLTGHDGVWTSACVRGQNGSGKTLWLEAITQLWRWFRRCARVKGWAMPICGPRGDLLREARLVAVFVSGLPDGRPPLWLAYGAPEEIHSLIGHDNFTSVYVQNGQPKWNIELLEWWDAISTHAELGQGIAPNMVHIKAEGKKFVKLRAGYKIPLEELLPMQILCCNEDGLSEPSHLEAKLVALNLANKAQYSKLACWVDQLFPGLELGGFDGATRRPLFRLAGTERMLTLDQLSAGEQSVLVNLGMVMSSLAYGGVVLIDEPELHQHISLMRGSVAILEHIIKQRGGQLIVASHAPEVWDHFRSTDAFIELPSRSGARP